MAVEVVDTNVWVNMDKRMPESEAEHRCLLRCIEWGAAFSRGTDDYKLAVDSAWKILTEYRQNIRRGGLAEQYLNALLSKPMARIEFVTIMFDENGDAILSENLTDDRKDRKFVAVALAFNPPATVVYSTETDWEIARSKLVHHGIPLRGLCPQYMQEKLKR